jgi:hypothetical protein
MSTIIRDINGNRVKETLSHYTSNTANTGHWHIDSTGLYCVDYATDSGRQFCAFIRPESQGERNAVQIAKEIGSPRP